MIFIFIVGVVYVHFSKNYSLCFFLFCFAIYKRFSYCLIHFTRNSIFNLTHVRLYNFFV